MDAVILIAFISTVIALVMSVVWFNEATKQAESDLNSEYERLSNKFQRLAEESRQRQES